MIYLGYKEFEKRRIIDEYCNSHSIEKVFIFSPSKFPITCDFCNNETVEWADIVMYKYYYRLLQEINDRSLVVINECLRTQNRYDLSYNCLRLYLQQAGHQLIFQYLPIIDTAGDFMVPFDFDTRSKWKREPISAELLRECRCEVKRIELSLNCIDVPVAPRTRELYEKKKRQLIDNLGLKDPHTIPRNLHLVGGSAKVDRVNQGGYYVGRNNRFKIPNMKTYREISFPDTYTVFEFCHNFIDFSDFLSLSKQTSIDVLVADLKVDRWYFQRYQNWIERINETYSIVCS